MSGLNSPRSAYTLIHIQIQIKADIYYTVANDQSLQMHTPSKRARGIIITELIKILYWAEMFPRKVLVSEGMIYDW